MLEDVCSLEELAEGRPTVVKLKGREIAIIRWRDEVHAVRNICPHQTQSFSCANVRPNFTAGHVGGLAVDVADPVMVCPVHTWSFHLKTGRCTVDESLRIRRYETVVQDGRLLIDVSS
ncbi:MAG: hypothetical protein DLM67_18175 [Candidatus Nephthysia bennettiae]|uniref:Nitrite reductase (NAD(P)H) small subunit n=1 Tax=Candidatus Nephthysia bennettiae TaxID=3127016 RepID=A0A934N8F4_9BACT|nr:nitrite reductase (NAD(P)H) small subunit [Candidatus Dormibacteraeota bacterium]MBJ7614044.1 nitrite reductase (NAD(P)H) small subunit [Candidatus Dormibacteraeota bacterium]PZR90114.1 MAG: hypothetical protein DLM67_18175 [Candidatus Dormibacteraeota bacterium]